MTVVIPTDETVLRTVSRELAGRSFIIATVGLHKLKGNAQSYWSVTGELYEPHGTWSGRARFNNDRDSDISGAIGDRIARAWPGLAPIVALHMSDADGVPMHALANGVYFLREDEPESAAKLWRCTVDELPTIDDAEAFVDAQRERWRSESAEAWAILQGLGS